MAKTNTGTRNVLTLNFVCEDWHEFLIRNQVHQYAPGCNTWYITILWFAVAQIYDIPYSKQFIYKYSIMGVYI